MNFLFGVLTTLVPFILIMVAIREFIPFVKATISRKTLWAVLVPFILFTFYNQGQTYGPKLELENERVPAAQAIEVEKEKPVFGIEEDKSKIFSDQL